MQRAQGIIDEMSAISNAGTRNKALSPDGQMAAILASPEPITLAFITPIVIDIAFKVYDNVSKRKAAARLAFAAEMKRTAQWTKWENIPVASPTPSPGR